MFPPVNLIVDPATVNMRLAWDSPGIHGRRAVGPPIIRRDDDEILICPSFSAQIPVHPVWSLVWGGGPGHSPPGSIETKPSPHLSIHSGQWEFRTLDSMEATTNPISGLLIHLIRVDTARFSGDPGSPMRSTTPSVPSGGSTRLASF